MRAAQSKKGQDVVVLDLREITTLADHFIILTGANARQNQAICDEIHLQVKQRGDLPISIEGYNNAEWVLMDYGDYIVHIFLDKARSYYDLERLWRHAKTVEIPPETIAAERLYPAAACRLGRHRMLSRSREWALLTAPVCSGAWKGPGSSAAART